MPVQEQTLMKRWEAWLPSTRREAGTASQVCTGSHWCVWLAGIFVRWVTVVVHLVLFV